MTRRPGWETALRRAAVLALVTSAAAGGGAASAATLECQCILATSLCNFARFDEAAGKPRQSWSQDFYPPGGQSTAHARALACWRKRDVDTAGAGLCCSSANDERDADRFFKGD